MRTIAVWGIQTSGLTSDYQELPEEAED